MSVANCRLTTLWGFVVLSAVSVASGGDGATPPGARASEGSDDTIDVVSVRRACGARSLCIWLRLLGYDVDYGEVLKRVPMTEKGSNLAQLSEAARHWTRNLEILKAKPRDLDRLPLPAIAHGWLDREYGHYVVLVKVTPGSVTYIDGAQGAKVDAARSEFLNKFWSGYVLAPRDVGQALARYLSLAVIAGVVLVGCGMLLRSRRRVPALASLIASVLAFGCDHGPRSGSNAPSSNTPSVLPAAADAPLAFSGSKKDLGIVRLGESAQAVFTLSNVGRKPIDLSLGQPSCGCLASSLTREHLEPGETSELSLLLSGGGDGRAGRLGGNNAVGIKGQENQLFFFEATGIVEGMQVDEYNVRVPADRSRTSPEPVRGEIDLGLNRPGARVQILEAVLKDNGAGLLKLGAPVMGDVETLSSHLRRRFHIPVSFAPGKDAQVSGVSELRITYRIDDRTADCRLRVLTFPEATVPTSTVNGER